MLTTRAEQVLLHRRILSLLDSREVSPFTRPGWGWGQIKYDDSTVDIILVRWSWLLSFVGNHTNILPRKSPAIQYFKTFPQVNYWSHESTPPQGGRLIHETSELHVRQIDIGCFHLCMFSFIWTPPWLSIPKIIMKKTRSLCSLLSWEPMYQR